MEKIEVMDKKGREKYLREKITSIVKLAYEKSEALRKKMDEAGLKPGDIKGPEDLEKMPITRKDEVITLQRENPPFGGFLASPEKVRHIFMSPGPIYEPHCDAEDYWDTERAFKSAGVRKDDIVLNTFSYHLTPGAWVIEEGLKKIGCRIVPAGVGNTELQVQLMAHLKVSVFVGTPSFLMTVMERAKNIGIDPKRDFSLRKALLAAEMVPPSVKKELWDEYGIEVFEFYGTAELGMLAYECGEKKGMHVEPNKYVEIVDPASGRRLPEGEAGEVVVTWFNPFYPLIRFGTGDLSSITEEPCPCGRTTPRLTRIMGRVGDAVKVRGMFLHPKQIDEALSYFPQVERYQAVIERVGHRDEVLYRIALKEEVENKEELKESIARKISDITKLKADKIEILPKGSIPEDARKIEDRRKWD